MRRHFAIALVILGHLASQANADVTDFTYSPSAPLMGEVVTYTAVNNNTKPVVSYKWEYKFTSGACAGTWVTSPSNVSTVAFFESRPGTWDVRLTVTYGASGGYPPPPPTVITKSVTIAPATKFSITSGLNTPTLNGQPIDFYFRVEGATRPCGTNLMGMFAQEKITNIWHLSPPWATLTEPDSDWIPANPPSNVFELVGNQIKDHKVTWVPPTKWNVIPAPSPFWKETQHIRLRYVDPCGDTKYIPLGSVVLERVKLNSTDYQFNTVP